jgi:hypothetical protein
VEVKIPGDWREWVVGVSTNLGVFRVCGSTDDGKRCTGDVSSTRNGGANVERLVDDRLLGDEVDPNALLLELFRLWGVKQREP